MLLDMVPKSRSFPLLPASILALSAGGFVAPVVAQTVSLNTGGEQVRIKIGDSAVLPEDFPADVVLPQPNLLVQLQRSNAELMVEMDTPGTLESVANQLRAGMLVNGWTAAAIDDPAVGSGQAWEKDARSVVAWLVPGPAGVRLQLRLGSRR